MMPFNKLVIRRLPPSMSEDDFLKQVCPLPNHDYFCFFEANSDLGPHSYSRAYINFLDLEDMSVFRERFDNYIFLDKDGHEYSAVVEQSLWHKSPKNGPFYISDNSVDDDETSTTATSVDLKKKRESPKYQQQTTNNLNSAATTTNTTPQTNLEASSVAATSSTYTSDPKLTNTSNSLWIEQDPEFIDFIEKLKAQKKRPNHSPIQTLETNLDELTNPNSNSSSVVKDNSKVITPLIGFVNQQRCLKNSSKRAK